MLLLLLRAIFRVQAPGGLCLEGFFCVIGFGGLFAEIYGICTYAQGGKNIFPGVVQCIH